jgi:hypothetical protein
MVLAIARGCLPTSCGVVELGVKIHHALDVHQGQFQIGEHGVKNRASAKAQARRCLYLDQHQVYLMLLKERALAQR